MKLTKLILLLLAATLVVGCKTERSKKVANEIQTVGSEFDKVHEKVAEMQKNLPFRFLETGMISDCFIEGKNFVCVSEIDESKSNGIDPFDCPFDISKKGYDVTMRRSGQLDFCKMLVDEGYGYVFKAKGLVSGKELEIKYSVAELKEFQKLGPISYKDSQTYLLEMNVYRNNKQPKEADSTFTSVHLELTDNLVFAYEILENDITNIATIRTELPAEKANYFESIVSSNSVSHAWLISLAVGAEKGLTIKYVNTIKTDSAEFSFTPAEVKLNYEKYKLGQMKMKLPD